MSTGTPSTAKTYRAYSAHIAIALVTVVLLFDFLFWKGGPSFQRQIASPSGEFLGRLQLRDLDFTPTGRHMSADVDLEVFATAPGAEIDYVIFAHHESPQAAADLVHFSLMDLGQFEEPNAAGSLVSLATAGLGSRTWDVSASRGESWFPFDSHRLAMRLRGCVNDASGGPCTSAGGSGAA